MSDSEARPRREDLIRAVMPGVDFHERSDGDDLEDGHIGLLRILFSPVNEWSEINSRYEGHFFERFAPGAWKKTISESATKIRALFEHGMDPSIGNKPLGPIRLLEERDGQGGYAEIPLLDTSYNRDLLPGLKAGLYGASHRFEKMRFDDDARPARSEHNPDGLMERTIKEARLKEFGPVTFPAYSGSTAVVRSMTDEFLMRAIEHDPDKAREMFDRALSLKDITPPSQQDTTQDEEQDKQDAPSEDDAEAPEPHLADERREDKPPSRRPIYGNRRKETSKWLLGPSKSTKRT